MILKYLFIFYEDMLFLKMPSAATTRSKWLLNQDVFFDNFADSNTQNSHYVLATRKSLVLCALFGLCLNLDHFFAVQRQDTHQQEGPQHQIL